MTGFICRALLWLAAVAALASRSDFAADTDPHAEDRKQLLHLRAEVEAGINAQNIARMLAPTNDNATMPWLNTEVSRVKADSKAYYRHMVVGEGAILKMYLTNAKLGAPAKFYEDIAVADGTAADEFFPWKRGAIRFNSNWSGTRLKDSSLALRGALTKSLVLFELFDPWELSSSLAPLTLTDFQSNETIESQHG